MSTPKEVLQYSINDRKEKIEHFEARIDHLVTDLCDAKEKMMEAKGELYEFEQAISQLYDK